MRKERENKEESRMWKVKVEVVEEKKGERDKMM